MYGNNWQATTKRPITSDGAEGSDSDDDLSVASQQAEAEPNEPCLADDVGIIPRCINELFAILSSKYTPDGYTLSMQMMQIYNERIYDLICDPKHHHPLAIRDDPHSPYTVNGMAFKGVAIPGLSVYNISSKAEALKLLSQALSSKISRTTDYNNMSSRSHTIVQLNVHIEEALGSPGSAEEGGEVRFIRKSSLMLVDLAGSEKWRDSLYNTADTPTKSKANTAKEVAEMNFINSSLHNLGHVIACLVENTASGTNSLTAGDAWETSSQSSQTSVQPSVKHKHIPFRDSLLTRILQRVFYVGRTIFLVTIYSNAAQTQVIEETYNSLLFANRASKVKMVLVSQPVTKSIGNGSGTGVSVVAALQEEVRLLKAQLAGGLATAACAMCVSLQASVADLVQENSSLKEQLASLRKYYDITPSTASRAFETVSISVANSVEYSPCKPMDEVNESMEASRFPFPTPKKKGRKGGVDVGNSIDGDGGIAFGQESTASASARASASAAIAGGDEKVGEEAVEFSAVAAVPVAIPMVVLAAAPAAAPAVAVSAVAAPTASAAVRASASLALPSVPAPSASTSPVRTSTTAATAVDGNCKKHGLHACVLCALFESPAPAAAAPVLAPVSSSVTSLGPPTATAAHRPWSGKALEESSATALWENPFASQPTATVSAAVSTGLASKYPSPVSAAHRPISGHKALDPYPAPIAVEAYRPSNSFRPDPVQAQGMPATGLSVFGGDGSTGPVKPAPSVYGSHGSGFHSTFPSSSAASSPAAAYSSYPSQQPYQPQQHLQQAVVSPPKEQGHCSSHNLKNCLLCSMRSSQSNMSSAVQQGGYSGYGGQEQGYGGQVSSQPQQQQQQQPAYGSSHGNNAVSMIYGQQPLPNPLSNSYQQLQFNQASSSNYQPQHQPYHQPSFQMPSQQQYQQPSYQPQQQQQPLQQPMPNPLGSSVPSHQPLKSSPNKQSKKDKNRSSAEHTSTHSDQDIMPWDTQRAAPSAAVLPPLLRPVPSDSYVSTLDSKAEDDIMFAFFQKPKSSTSTGNSTGNSTGHSAGSSRLETLHSLQSTEDLSTSPVIGIRRLLKAGHKTKQEGGVLRSTSSPLPMPAVAMPLPEVRDDQFLPKYIEEESDEEDAPEEHAAVEGGAAGGAGAGGEKKKKKKVKKKVKMTKKKSALPAVAPVTGGPLGRR